MVFAIAVVVSQQKQDAKIMITIQVLVSEVVVVMMVLLINR